MSKDNFDEPPSSGRDINLPSRNDKQHDMDNLFHLWQRRIGAMSVGGRVLVIAHKRIH